MFEAIPKNSTVANYRRIYFTLVDSVDLFTPEDIVVTGVKMNLSFNGAAFAASTNDIVKVNGTFGEYYIELTQGESDTALGIVRGYIQPTGCALTKIQALIVSDEVFAAALSASAIAQQTFKEDITGITGEANKSLLNFIRAGGLPMAGKIVINDTTKVMTVYKEDETTVAFTMSYLGNITTISEIQRV